MAPDEPEFPVAGGPYPADRPEEPRATRGPDRDRDPRNEPSAAEQLGTPARPGRRAQKSILYFCLFFLLAFLAMTAAVIAESGVDFVMVIAVVLCSVGIYALIGMIRYEGEDPMAKFDPPELGAKRRWRRR